MIDSVEGSGAPLPDFKKARRVKAPAVDPEKLNRMPPHSIEAEQGVLGCLLLDPQQSVGEILNRFKGTPEFFYHLPHRTVFEHVVAMADAREAVDLITLQQRLKDRGELEAIGGLAYLVSLQDAVPSAANLTYYLDIVWEKYLLRRVLRACADVSSKVYDVETEVDKFVDEVETEFLRLSEEKEASKAGAVTMKDLVHEAIGKIEEMHANKGSVSGIATGFHDLDRMTSGFQPGDMVVIAARPSVGKTSLAMNVAEHVALRLQVPVGVFSLEMSASSLVLRLLCSHARVNLRTIREGMMGERDFPKLTRAAGELCQSPLFIDDTAGLSILQLRAKARRMHQQHGIKLFVIDYLQLLHSTSRRADNRQQEVADISTGIKALAKELKVPVIVLCQLNREPEKRGAGEKPKLSDLRESGSIEQDADVVGLLYRDVKDADEVIENDTFPVNLFIAKQRNGPVGEVPLMFHKGLTRFESASRVSDDDVPRPTAE
jgi:replicative DNA helicase